MSEIKVNSIKGVAATAAALSINNTDGTCTANITNNLSNRNLVINGAFLIAQRGTSSTTNAYSSVDRWRGDDNGTDEQTTKSQVDVASGTTPYTLGFRKAFRLTNGNQTSGAGTTDHATMTHYFEAQNMSNSGWNYISATSYITLSFWVKASVAQNYYGYVRTHDGSSYLYPFETGSLTADTWTKVTKTIPGNSNLTINNDNGVGFSIFLSAYRGTDQTGSITLNQWGAYDSTVRAPDYATTWWTTNDATFEITGVQLEVGSVATDFEHRSFDQELTLCQRYYQVIAKGSDGTAGARAPLVSGQMWGTTGFYGVLPLKTKMRTLPSLDVVNGTNYWQVYNNTTDTCDTLAYNNASPEAISLYLSGNLSGTAYVGGWSRTNNAAAFVAAKAEL